MDAYIYCADIYCTACGEEIRQRLIDEGKAPSNYENESSFDSDEFPKGPYEDGGGESDTPCHCGSGKDCLNYIELSDGTRIGCWLENDLTTDGVEYVNEYIREMKRSGKTNEVTLLWYTYYCNDYELEPLEDMEEE